MDLGQFFPNGYFGTLRTELRHPTYDRQIALVFLIIFCVTAATTFSLTTYGLWVNMIGGTLIAIAIYVVYVIGRVSERYSRSNR